MIADRVGTTADVVESVENRPPKFGERLLEAMTGALPELSQPAAWRGEDIEAAIRREVERLIREAAQAGDVVILGRFGGGILGERPDVVRVFLHAPLAWRIAHVQASLGMNPAAARSEIARIDEARSAYAREQYRMAWHDPRSYDLTVDTSRYGIEGSADVIAAAVRAAHDRA